MSEETKNFKELVDMAMSNPSLAAMRPVVEKELLHYEIFQALDTAGLLKNLVFQGGTALRLCRGSARFSEDLDFAGGEAFSSATMGKIKECIETQIGNRFGLRVEVKPPSPSSETPVRVDKWLISIETAAENRAIARQRIKLEIANVPAYTRELVPLRINYDFLFGMPTVMVPTESLNEILADKIVAFPTSLLDNQKRPNSLESNRIRHRDLWDLSWLTTQNATLDPTLVVAKIRDYGLDEYPHLLMQAIEQIPHIIQSPAFKSQMERFIDSKTMEKTIINSAYLNYLANSNVQLFTEMKRALIKS